MTEHLKIIFVALFIVGLFWASHASAQGLVPCGRREAADPEYRIGGQEIDVTVPCTLCHFFILIARLIHFILFDLVPPLALLMLVIGGGMFMISSGNPQTITTAKKMIGSVFIGLIVIYGAYFFIGVLLRTIGLTGWAADAYDGWITGAGFTIECEVPTTTPAGP